MRAVDRKINRKAIKEKKRRLPLGYAARKKEWGNLLPENAQGN